VMENTMKPKEANGRLLAAARSGDIVAAKEALDAGADVNVREGILQLTPLDTAAMDGRPAIVTLLLERGADPNAPGKHGVAPLHWAARHGQTEVGHILIENGADVNLKDFDLETALYKAASRGHTDFVQLLLDNGADINAAEDRWRRTAIDEAAANRHLDTVRLLIERGADHRGLLHTAASRNQTDLAALLLDNGDDINAVKDGYRETPLHLAVGARHTDMIRWLLERGASPHVEDYVGTTPMALAAARGHTDIMKLLETTAKNPLGHAGRVEKQRGNSHHASDQASRVRCSRL